MWEIVRDKSNGYEAIAEAFAGARTLSIGPAVVRQWLRRVPSGAAILDLGCGWGVPISEVLLQEGFLVYGVDASETLVGKFRRRFPEAIVECEAVEDSAFFNRTFEAVVAWGLLFLLSAETQRRLLAKVATALKRDGHLLFTSPKEACSWTDGMTGLPSLSLGHHAYARELSAQGLSLVGNTEDEGQNYYYFATKCEQPQSETQSAC